MDLHGGGNPRLHYKLNGCQQNKDDGLQFLSMEEQECILFFEETIDSLEEGFEDKKGFMSRRSTSAGGFQTSSNSALSPASPNLMENDIIDLVHSSSNFTLPDFQNLAVAPVPYDETTQTDSMESVVPSLTTRSDAHEENNNLLPPGSVPTPVVIASKIAEHQGTGGITPSTLLEHRRSLESKREPPRPVQLPSKISITRSHQDPNPYSFATAAVNVQERRSQMLANRPIGSHPLEGGEPGCVRIVPMHSVSFKDVMAEKSRMEALSKLGLMGTKTPRSTASIVTKGSSSTTSPSSSSYKVIPTKVSSSLCSPMSNVTNVSSNFNSPISSSSSSTQVHVANSINTFGQKKNSNPSVIQYTSGSGHEPKFKSEVSSSNFNYYGGKTATIMPSTKDTDTTVNQERRSSSAEVKQTDFNSYGGKTIILNPTMSVKAEPGPFPSANIPEPAETQFNSYGGRSRVIHPVVPTDVPNDGTSQSPVNIVPPITYDCDPTTSRHASEQNSYNVKPKLLTPLQPDLVYQPTVKTRLASLPSPTFSRPQCPTGSLKPRLDPIPPEILSKPVPSFRTQGVTVQFSGKGTTGEARRDALRRLGLLKNTS